MPRTRILDYIESLMPVRYIFQLEWDGINTSRDTMIGYND